MLTLEDILNLPNNPTDEHKVAVGLLPKPQPLPSVVPAPGGPIPTPSVTPRPAVDWKAKVAATAPHTAPTVPEMPPVNPTAFGAPDLGTGIPEDTSGVQAAATGKIPELPKLGFKERQALPLSSEGVAPGSPEYFRAQAARLEDQRNNPWGSAENHPGLLGKIGHVAAKIGNIAGNIVAPATMANIPGTELNKQEELNAAEGKAAKATEAESEQKLRAAETTEAEARAKKLGAEGAPDIVQDASGNAVGWRDEKGALHSLDEEGTPASIKGIAEKWEGKAAAKPQKENLEQGLAGALQDALDNGRDPKTDAKVQGWAQAIKDYKPSKDTDVKTVEDLKHRIVTAMESGDVAGARQLQNELNATDPEGMARLADAQARMAATAADRAERKEEREEKQGLKWVTGEVPGTHQTVTVPFSQAKAMNLENQAEANADHVNKVLAARVVVPMLYNTDKTDLGVLQLIDELGKNGDLGAVASRWNDFMVRKVGADQTKGQLFTKLRTKLDLAQTKMMQAHVGNRGGAFMLEHFEDLANAGKLNADTLRAAVDTELRYMDRNAEKPRAGAAVSGGEKSSGHSFSINGQRYENVPNDVYERAKKKPGFKE